MMDVTEFTHRIEPLRPRIIQLAQSIVQDADTAQDLAQECMIRLWQQRQRLAEVDSLEAFSSTIIRHLGIDYLRSSHAFETLSHDSLQLSDPVFCSDRNIERRDLGEVIELSIQKLPSLQQSIFRLKEQDALENEEIAQIMGIAVEAVYNHLSRARKTLRTLLQKTYEDLKK